MLLWVVCKRRCDCLTVYIGYMICADVIRITQTRLNILREFPFGNQITIRALHVPKQLTYIRRGEWTFDIQAGGGLLIDDVVNGIGLNKIQISKSIPCTCSSISAGPNVMTKTLVVWRLQSGTTPSYRVDIWNYWTNIWGVKY